MVVAVLHEVQQLQKLNQRMSCMFDVHLLTAAIS